MTLQELNQLAYLETAIKTEKDRLDRLRDSAGLKSPSFEDMPHGKGTPTDRVGQIVPEIIDQEQAILDAIGHYMEAQEQILSYINAIYNARMRTIFILRFVEQKTWQDIADALGGKETEYSVKHACYRYLGEREDPDWQKYQISMFEDEE